MIGVDDLLDIALDALTHEPGEPHPQPLFLVTHHGPRMTTRVLKVGSGKDLIGARQVVEIEGVGRFSIHVEEVGGS